MPALESFEKMLADGKDSAMLRYGLAMEYLKLNNAAQAILHLEAALEKDANYSAAWKNLGRAHEAHGDLLKAAETYTKGIQVANQKGDKQTAKEMSVYLRRIDKKLT